MEIKQLIRTLKKTNPFIESNIFRSVENVNLDTVVGYKQYGERHYFLENYDKMGELKQEELFLVMFSVVALQLLEIELLQAVWVIELLNFLKKVKAIELL